MQSCCGFCPVLLWPQIGEMVNCWTFAACHLGWHRVARRYTSVFPLVQKSRTYNQAPAFLFFQLGQDYGLILKNPRLDKPQGLWELLECRP